MQRSMEIHGVIPQNVGLHYGVGGVTCITLRTCGEWQVQLHRQGTGWYSHSWGHIVVYKDKLRHIVACR